MHNILFFNHNINGDIMDFSHLLDVTFRALISLLTLFLITKMLGKKQVSEMSLFDYVIGISIGNFAAEMTINLETAEINGVFAVVVFGLVAILVSFISMHSIRLRKFFVGVPTIVIQDGKILKKNMKKLHLNTNELLEDCRIKGYFDIKKIAYAIMEVNGDLSVLPKASYATITPNDMNMSVSKEYIPATVIMDGRILEHNLSLLHKDKNWLLQKLKEQGFNDLNRIILCTLNKTDVDVYLDNENVKTLDILQ